MFSSHDKGFNLDAVYFMGLNMLYLVRADMHGHVHIFPFFCCVDSVEYP